MPTILKWVPVSEPTQLYQVSWHGPLPDVAIRYRNIPCCIGCAELIAPSVPSVFDVCLHSPSNGWSTCTTMQGFSLKITFLYWDYPLSIQGQCKHSSLLWLLYYLQTNIWNYVEMQWLFLAFKYTIKKISLNHILLKHHSLITLLLGIFMTPCVLFFVCLFLKNLINMAKLVSF